MQKNIPILLLLTAGVIFAVSTYGKSEAAKNLKVLFQDLKFEKATGYNLPVMALNFKIINPTSSPLKISSIAGDLFVNGKLLSTVSQLNAVNIPANNTTFYTLRAETSITAAVSNLLSLIKNRGKITITFEGVVNSSGFSIPVSQTIIKM